MTRSEEARTKRWAILAPIVIGLIAALLTFAGFLSNVHDELSELKARVDYAEKLTK